MTDYSVIVSPSKIKGAGLGLFATKAFKSGEVVCNYGGELILTDFQNRARIGLKKIMFYKY